MNLSLSFVVWFSFLGEGFESLFSILCVDYSFVVESLYLESCSKVHLWSPVYRFLGVFNPQWGIWEHLIDEVECSVLCLFMVLLDVADNSVLFGLLSVNFPCSEDQLLSKWGSDKSCQGLCSSSPWNQTPISLRESQKSSFCGYSDICVQCQLQASSKCRTINNWDDWTMYVPNIIKNPPQVRHDQLNIFRGLLQPLLKIRPCTKMSRLATPKHYSP